MLDIPKLPLKCDPIRSSRYVFPHVKTFSFTCTYNVVGTTSTRYTTWPPLLGKHYIRGVGGTIDIYEKSVV